ncbi:MAG: transglutaminase-like domain-containing protein [Syntrophales bacterium]|jgi:hypothetical protein
MYFKKSEPLTQSVKMHDLSGLTWREQWQGIVFNGEKVGFSLLKIIPLPEDGLYSITSEAHLHIKFIGINKTILMTGNKTVRKDLTLSSFHYELKLNEEPLLIDGNVHNGRLQVVLTNGTRHRSIHKQVGTLYPSSAVNLYPILEGLSVGNHYKYTVFDPETQTVCDVEQTIAAFEQSEELKVAPSFRVGTNMLGHQVRTWINSLGESLLKLGLNGAIVTHQEDEAQTRDYLSESALARRDVILDISLIKTEKPLLCPRQTTYLEAVISNFPLHITPLNDSTQIIQAKEGEASAFSYKINRVLSSSPSGENRSIPGSSERMIDLLPADHVESNHPEIREKVSEILAGAETPLEKTRKLVAWVSQNIKDDIIRNFSALDVLHKCRGECQAHSMLYIAMARAAGIPSRFAGGIVYLAGKGFLYHSWVESDLGSWVPVDPAFNQVGVDATHIKLVEGSDWISLLPLGQFVGRIGIRIIDYRSTCPQ